MKSCYLIDFKPIGNEKVGYLIPIEENKDIPFDTKRIYYIYSVPEGVERGFHAHKTLEQVLICISGSVKIKCFDGIEEIIFELDSKEKGLYIGGMVWREMFDYTEGSILLVLAAQYYNESDYIREFEDFINIYNNFSNDYSLAEGD